MFFNPRMWLNTAPSFTKFKISLCRCCQTTMTQRCWYSLELENKYTDEQKEKILRVINDCNAVDLSGYDVTKGRAKKFSQWKCANGQIKTISDVELVDGFSEKTAKKLFNSILEGPPVKVQKVTSRLKGQILHPHLSESVRQNCKTVLAVHVAVNSVCWTLIDRTNFEVMDWTYHGIDYPDGKRFQITDILNIAWSVIQKLPSADIYVMKAEATTLRAAGSDPNNPKVIAVNLQKAQLVAMIVALINAISHSDSFNDAEKDEAKQIFEHKVYFLRPSLPYRLYGTLVGTEKVSTDQTVEMLIQNIKDRPNKSDVFMSDELKNMFRAQRDLQKDMLGHCLLLGLTFMDVCIYRNQESINKLAKREK